MTIETALQVVCPHCGSGDRIGTRERAEIWQPCSFTLQPDDEEPDFEDSAGRGFTPEWDAYDSDDVGDTETVGFFCQACLVTWDGSTLPFITRAEWEQQNAA